MQEQVTMGSVGRAHRDIQFGPSLVALLALVGTKRMDVHALRARTRLTPLAFNNLMGWLEREYLVDVVSSLEGDLVGEKVGLTDRGEALLLSMLERTYELPELR